MDEKIPLPEIQFDSERVRYEHRLLPFSSLLTPPPVHYQEFLDMTNAQMHKRNVSLMLKFFIFKLYNNKTITNRSCTINIFNVG